MKIAVIGANGVVGRACMAELQKQGCAPIPLCKSDAIPTDIERIILAAPLDSLPFDGPVVDCSRVLKATVLALPAVQEATTKQVRTPNCMASLIAQALHPLHQECIIHSIVATCMQSASGAGRRGVEALEQNSSEELFHGQLQHNILPHEDATQEEQSIANDLQELFGCVATATAFRVPVHTGHLASLRVTTKHNIPPSLLQESSHIDPLSLQGTRDVSIGRIRIQKNTADLVVCGDQLVCGTAIPAVQLILGL